MLSSAEKKVLRGEAQLLKPRVKIGKQGVSAGVLEQITAALAQDKLIKIRFDANRDEITLMLEDIIAKTGAELVGRVGKTASVFRNKVSEKLGEG